MWQGLVSLVIVFNVSSYRFFLFKCFHTLNYITFFFNTDLISFKLLLILFPFGLDYLH